MDRLRPVIATRVLAIKNTKKKIRIKIGKPRQMHDGPIYHCFYQILGINDNGIRQSPAGLDSMHAIQLVMQKIGVDLFVINQSYGGALSWEGSENDDLGFFLPNDILSILKS